MKNKTVHLFAVFLVVYTGIEITIGGIIRLLRCAQQKKVDNCKSGWIVTFLVLVRGGGPSSGYVETGFFGGKYLVTLYLPMLKLFLIRYYFGTSRLSWGD